MSVPPGALSRHLARTAAAVTLLAVSACASPDSPDASEAAVPTPETASAVAPVAPATFAAAVAEPDRVTVNVHVPYAGELDGTDLFLPYDQVQADAAQLPADRDTALAVYCLTGAMSAVAVDELRSMGYTDVVELRGGMAAWEASGLPLQR